MPTFWHGQNRIMLQREKIQLFNTLTERNIEKHWFRRVGTSLRMMTWEIIPAICLAHFSHFVSDKREFFSKISLNWGHQPLNNSLLPSFSLVRHDGWIVGTISYVTTIILAMCNIDPLFVVEFKLWVAKTFISLFVASFGFGLFKK